MVERIYYPPKAVKPMPKVVGRKKPMHGYTLDDIHNATWIAVSTKLFLAADRQDLYQAAWDGIVDLLCTAGEPPTWYELTRAGQAAIQRLRDEHLHHHGYDRIAGSGAASNFNKYWAHHPTWQSQVEETVVERVAKGQILATLPANQLLALFSRGAAGSLTQAAEASGLTYSYMAKLIGDARKRFLSLWHEHETPVNMHRKQYMRKDVAHAPCGTPGGYSRHRYFKEKACDSCRAAVTAYAAERRRARAS